METKIEVNAAHGCRQNSVASRQCARPKRNTPLSILPRAANAMVNSDAKSPADHILERPDNKLSFTGHNTQDATYSGPISAAYSFEKTIRRNLANVHLKNTVAIIKHQVITSWPRTMR